MTRIISEVEIKNFRQFHDIQLRFKNSLNVIIGGNRFGKTNFLNAMLWCMYGEGSILQESKESGKHFIKNERFLDDETKVSIFMNEKDSGRKDKLIRTEKGLSILVNTAGKFEPKEEIEIRQILPENVRNFFLFKGEFLDSFFDYNGEIYLKETILEVSKINQLNKIKDILESLEEKYRKQIQKENRNDQQIKKLSERIDRWSETIKKLRAEVEEIEQKMSIKKKRIREINLELKNFDEAAIKNLLKEEENLNKDKEFLNVDIRSIREKIFQMFFEEISYSFSFEAIEILKEELNKLENQGLIPPPITPSLINKILKERKCICGTELDNHMEQELKSLLTKVQKDTDKLQQLNKLNLSLDTSKERFYTLTKKIDELVRNLVEKEERLKEINKALRNISEKIKGLDKSSVNRLLAERESLEEEIQNLESEKVDKLSDIKNFEIEKKATEIEYNKTVSKYSGTETITKKLEYIGVLKNKIENLSNAFLQEMISSLNKQTRKNFNDIFWDNYRFIDYDIKITDDFEIEVISPEGNNMISLLSTGEKKVLAMSFILALSEFYGFDFPITIDAPFTALQREVILKVLDTLIKVSSKKQIIILTIPHENDIMNKLTKHADKVYRFEKDKDDNTVIKEIK